MAEQPESLKGVAEADAGAAEDQDVVGKTAEVTTPVERQGDEGATRDVSGAGSEVPSDADADQSSLGGTGGTTTTDLGGGTST